MVELNRPLLFLMAICWSLLQAYDYDAHKNPITDKRLKLVVVPMESQYKKLSFTAAKVVEAEASRLKRFQVISLNPGGKKRGLLSRTVSRNFIKQLAKSTDASEALSVSVLAFEHRKVKIKEPLTGKKMKGRHMGPFKPRMKPRKRLMHSCAITIMINKIRLADGIITSSKEFKRSVQMNTKKEAIQSLLTSFGSELRKFFKSIYIMESEIIKVEFDRLVLRLGKNMGIPKNTIFKIRTRSRTEYVGEEELEFPGEVVALARVTEVGEEASVAHLIRQWDHINIDYQAVEMLSTPGVWKTQGLFGLPDGYWVIGFQYVFNPLGHFNYELSLRLSRAEDSRRDGGHMGFGFGTALTYRLPVQRLFRLKPGIGYTLDIYGRDNDNQNGVLNFVHCLPLTLDTEWVLSKRWNLTVGAAYHLLGTSNSWTGGEESQEANWNPGTIIPRMDLSGMGLRLSLDFLWF
jgi:hypothetical protein